MNFIIFTTIINSNFISINTVGFFFFFLANRRTICGSDRSIYSLYDFSIDRQCLQSFPNVWDLFCFFLNLLMPLCANWEQLWFLFIMTLEFLLVLTGNKYILYIELETDIVFVCGISLPLSFELFVFYMIKSREQGMYV